MLAEKALTEKGARAINKDTAGAHDDAPQEHGDHEECGGEKAEDPPLGTSKAATTRKSQQKEPNRTRQGRKEENSRGRKLGGVQPRKSTVAGEFGA